MKGIDFNRSPSGKRISVGKSTQTGKETLSGKREISLKQNPGSRLTSNSRHYSFPGERFDTEIVGVAKDARTQTLHDAPVAMTYFPADQLGLSRNTVFTNLDVRVAGDAAAMLPVIREALRRNEPNLLVSDINVMSRRLERDLSRERLVAALAFSFGLLTLLLASIGLYGVLSYGVARRTQEIGVRMALGAKRIEVMGIVLTQSAKLTISGIVLGLIATAMGVRYLSGMLYGVQPFDQLTFVTVVVTFAIVTTLAAFVPARRATKVDPLVALRSE